MKTSKIVLIIIVGILIACFFTFDLTQYFSLGYFKSQQAQIDNYYQAHPVQTALIFFTIYVAVTGLSLPAATILTLAAGAIFGLMWGTVIVSFASTVGATLAFLVSRFLLRDFVQNKFGKNLRIINQGIEKEGALYLLILRLVPIVPFFVVNLVMGLTTIRIITFFLISQIGMLAATAVYVNAGTEIAKIQSLNGILSLNLILSFALLGIFPLIAKRVVDFIKARKILKKYPKPEKFDYNLIAIGAGAAGLVTTYIGAAVKAKVALIEKHKMGGDCLNTGCVPSKALIRSAKFLSHIRRAQEFGFKSANADFDFAEIMERVQNIIKTVQPHDSIERYTKLGVDCISGEAKITSPYTIEVNGKILTTRNIVIATGASPFVPPIQGIENIDYLTSDTIWNIRTLPKRLLILGGGPIGCELTQCFARLGSQVTQVEMAERLMVREDPEISDIIQQSFQTEGIDLRLNHRAKAFQIENGRKTLICAHENQDVSIEFDEVLIAVGRQANIKGFGLEALGVEISPRGTIAVNEFLQTNFPNIYACGDVVGPYQFTHTAAHQAWYASVNALFSGFKKFKVDYSVIPWSTFTDPEVARVGINEQEAKNQGIPYEITHFGIDNLDRAIADSEAHGLVKVLTVPNKDKILGVTIVGEHAGDLIAEYVMAMRHGLGLNKILGTIHIYPTLAEANKYAAGEWKRNHAPEKVLKWLAKFHSWRRD